MKTDKLTVLILEDTPADAEMIANVLRGANLEFTAVQVDHEQEFCSLLQRVSPDLIFADNSLLLADEKSALSASRHLHPAVPFIVISDTPGEEAAVEAVRRGATDYVLKDRMTRLGPAVQRALKEGGRQCRPRGPVEHACCNEREDHDPRICELNQLLRAIREINKLILRERQPEVLLADACNVLIRTRGYLHVGI
ncbi:MAG TPA: response regulator, partial [Candidatus Paceibacterota bacterium]|nr:response regulator [Candidatus Paceibacterota bacterium]